MLSGGAGAGDGDPPVLYFPDSLSSFRSDHYQVIIDSIRAEWFANSVRGTSVHTHCVSQGMYCVLNLRGDA